jgi:hypothetical protein
MIARREAMRRGTMIAIADSPMERIVHGSHIRLRAGVLTLLGIVVLAAGVQASSARAEGTAPLAGETPAGEAAEGSPPKESSEGAAGGQGSGEQTGGTVASKEAEKPVEAVTPPAEASEVVVAPEKQPTEAASEPTSPVAGPVEKTEKPIEEAASGKSSETVQASLSSHSDPPAPTTDVLTRTEGTGESAQQVVGAVVASLAAGSTVIGPLSTKQPASPGARAAAVAAERRSDALTCELSSLVGREASNCSAGWLDKQSPSSGSTVSLAASTVSLASAAVAGSRPGGGHSGSAGGSAPVSPSPSPAPGGASGSAPASSGLGLSTFLTLAGLLLMGAPRAMRRLRLSCEPWLTACFVLIPERPG